jgi:hypothetical protein
MIPTVLLPQPLVASEKLNADVVCTDSVIDTCGPFYALVIYYWLTLSENWSQVTTKEYGGGGIRIHLRLEKMQYFLQRWADR